MSNQIGLLSVCTVKVFVAVINCDPHVFCLCVVFGLVRTIWNVMAFPDMSLVQSLSGFKGWIQHCVWTQCDGFLIVVSDAFLYVYKSTTSGEFIQLTHFKPHNYPVSDVFSLKNDIWVDPVQIEREYFEEKSCHYTIVTCSYDGTISVWKMQDIMDGRYSAIVDKNKVNVPKNNEGWDSSIMAYGFKTATCTNSWGK